MAIVVAHAEIRAEFAKTVGIRIARARKKLKLSQAQLADELGLGHSTTVTYWEAGRNYPPSYLLADIADALDMELDDLIRW
jgi:transcriptional regulator with XRE-family HTH domain